MTFSGAIEGGALGTAGGAALGSGLVAAADWLSNAMTGGQGNGNFERKIKGDDTAANKKANEACKKAKLNDDEIETFHDIPGKENMTFEELYQLARAVKAGLYH